MHSLDVIFFFYFVHPEIVNHYSAYHFTWKISLWAFSYIPHPHLSISSKTIIATLFTGNTLIFGVKWIFSHHFIFTFPFWLVHYLDDLSAAPLFVFENGHLKLYHFPGYSLGNDDISISSFYNFLIFLTNFW